MGAGFGMALAGAAEGVGKALVSEAKSKREEGLMLLKRQWQLEDRQAKGTSSGRRGFGRQGNDSSTEPVSFSNSDEVRLEKAYNSAFSDGFGGEVPTLSQFKNEVLRLMSEDGMTRVDAESKAIQSWGSTEQTSTTEQDRGIVGRNFEKITGFGGGDGKKTVTETKEVFGFQNTPRTDSSGRQGSQDDPFTPQNESDYQKIPSGSWYLIPDDSGRVVQKK